MRSSSHRLVCIFLCLGLAVGCSANTQKTGAKRFPESVIQEAPSAELSKPMPWEIWALFRDLNGVELRNRALILGDELQEQGKRRSALDAYLKASSESLVEGESQAAAIRVASQYLALDQAKKSLSAIGAFYKRRGMAEANVDVPFGLVLAFAYGRHGDIEQSMAWFSKVATQSRVDGPAIQVARSGTAMLLQTLRPEDFERIAENWRADTFINEQIGRERLRRSSPSYVAVVQDAGRPFWLGFDQSQTSLAGSNVAQPMSGAPVVGLVLSLSDRFAALGRDTQRGFDLAIEANNTTEPKVKVEARDVGADTAAASAAVRELAAGPHASVVAGPLLTEPAVAAAQTAREVGVPLLSFSKSDSFATGNGIFRLGATTTSQIEALVNAAYGDYHITRFAAAYPNSPSGSEFVEALKKRLGSLNLSLELEVSYVSGDETSMLEVAQQLEGTSAEAVLIPDSVDASAKLLANLSPTLKKRMRPLGTALWDNTSKVARSQALFERAIFVTPFFTQSNRSEVQQFVTSFKGKYNTAPNFLAAQGFDAGTLIVNALRKALQDRSTFEPAMRSLPPYSGVTGLISVLPSGEVSRSFYVVEVLRDSFQEKMPMSNPPRYDSSQLSADAAKGAQTPRLGDTERVESGY